MTLPHTIQEKLKKNFFWQLSCLGNYVFWQLSFVECGFLPMGFSGKYRRSVIYIFFGNCNSVFLVFSMGKLSVYSQFQRTSVPGFKITNFLFTLYKLAKHPQKILPSLQNMLFNKIQLFYLPSIMIYISATLSIVRRVYFRMYLHRFKEKDELKKK